MKNFKSYDNFLLEYKDNWKEATQNSGAAVTSTAGGIKTGLVWTAKKVYDGLSSMGKKSRLRKLKKQLDFYLETVYEQYLTEQQTPTTPEKEEPLEISTPKVGINADNETEVESGVVTDEESEEEAVPLEISAPEVGVNADNESDEESEEEESEEEESEEEESEEESGKLTDKKYFRSVWDGIESDKEEVLNSIPNPDLEEDYKAWEQSLNDLLQDIENFVDDLSHGLEDVPSNLPFFKEYGKKAREIVAEIKGYMNLNEAVDWRGDAVAPKEGWTDKDRQKVTNKVNPFMIEEILLKKELYTTTDKLKTFWTMLENEVYKKWHYVFIIDDLKSKSKKVSLALDKPSKQKTMNMIQHDYMSEKLKTKTVLLSNTDLEGYYLLNLLNSNDPEKNSILMVFEAEKSMFKIIGKITVKNDEIVLVGVGKHLVFNNKRYELLKGEDNYSCIKLSAYGNSKMKIEFGNKRVTNMLTYGANYVIDAFDSDGSAELLLSTNNLKEPSANIDNELINRF
jgi:hypothetical protein